jgi:2-oxoisovalerate dehydrogenase E2 component (dihydrolipoyl transacylase)
VTVPDFRLPDLGEGLEEAEVIAWRVKPGDHVAVDQVIAEVETAKAVVEVPVPYAGVVTALHAEPGGVVSVGQPLITVTADAAVTASEGAAGFREPGVVVPEQVPATADRTASSGVPGSAATAQGDREKPRGEEASGSVLIGYGTTAAPARSGRRGRRRGTASAPPASASPASAPPARAARSGGLATPEAPPPAAPAALAAAPAAAAAPAEPAAPAAPAAPASPGDAPGRHPRVAVISPLVRKQARDAGLDLASLAGTGPAGVISREDVRQAIAERAQGAESAAGAEHQQRQLRPEPDAPGEGSGTEAGIRRIPLRGARRAMADKLSRSRREIPEATVWVDVDATGLVEARRALNAAAPARPVSLLALLARFTILGLRRYPELNARVEQDEIVVLERVNLGFAAQTEHGLVVPVVPDAHRLTTRELSARLAEHTTAARERRLAPADLTGGTFTVNNYGVFGVDGSAAIINHPEVAILGMGRVIDRPWVVNGELTVRKVAELTLAFDHRACDGGSAGGFLRYVADCIESPTTALGDL